MRRLLKGWIVVSFQLVVLMTLTKPPSYRGRTVPASGFKGPSDGGAVPAPPSGALPSARTPAAPVEPAPPAAAPPAASTSNAGSSLDRDRMDRWLFFMGLQSRCRHDRLPGAVGADLLSVQELRIHPVDDQDALEGRDEGGVLLPEPHHGAGGVELDDLDALRTVAAAEALPVGGDEIAVGQDLEVGEGVGV